MMIKICLNNTMKRFILSMILLFTFLSPTKVLAEYNENYDWNNDQQYQNLAEDFRTYSICEAVHKTLSVFIAINYGVGSNMNYPAEWLTQQKGLIQNINSQQVLYGDKTNRVIEKLMSEYNFPYQMLEYQKTDNQARSTQSIMIAMSMSSQDPDRATTVIAGMLTESQKCRSYQEKGDYEK